MDQKQTETPSRKLLASIFENLKNLVLCSLLIAAGVYEHAQPAGLTEWIAFDRWLGVGLIAAGLALAGLNLREGLFELAKLPFRRISITSLSCVYILASARLIMVMTAFRVAG